MSLLLPLGDEEIMASPDLTRVPPANQIVDNQNAVWTIVGNQIRRNSTQAGDGLGSVITWCGGVIRVLGTDNQWWAWDGTTWASVGRIDPCQPPPPPPSPRGDELAASLHTAVAALTAALNKYRGT